MRRLISEALLWTVIGVVAAPLHLCAGTIIVSGDSNIADIINIHNSFTNGYQNGAFFSDILGQGDDVLIQSQDATANVEASHIADYYNSGANITASLTNAASVTSLTGVDLFVSIIPTAPYTAGQLAAMSSLLSAGGTVFFIAENADYMVNSLPYINSALSYLGSPMSLVPALDDPGIHNATGAQIAASPLTQGVSNFWYAYTSEVAGGTPLLYTQSLTPFVSMSYTPVGPISSNQGVPEPGTTGLILVGLAVAGWRVRAARRPN
ncbi:MAG TPA: PEP-CTERM sorting domain-containing protein [Bryobacteraceae bacterium]|nr:PEP-CTERM sorting domain-containing protein [Bryobacteraceae bacterium]